VQAVKKSDNEIYGIISEGNAKPYNIVDIIECFVDANSFDQFKEDYGKTIVCGYARVDGWAVGIVANQRLIVKNKKGEMQLGGVIYNDSADKAARFILKLQPKKDTIGFSAGCNRLYGGKPK
jgi:acetyl-CoA carboxylase carboxyltransferase component